MPCHENTCTPTAVDLNTHTHPLPCIQGDMPAAVSVVCTASLLPSYPHTQACTMAVMHCHIIMHTPALPLLPLLLSSLKTHLVTGRHQGWQCTATLPLQSHTHGPANEPVECSTTSAGDANTQTKKLATTRSTRHCLCLAYHHIHTKTSIRKSYAALVACLLEQHCSCQQAPRLPCALQFLQRTWQPIRPKQQRLLPLQ